MKYTILRSVYALWDIIKAPELRNEIHYECGLYKKKSDHTPIASMRIGNDFSVSLIKLLAIVAGVIAGIVTLRKLTRAWGKLCCRVCEKDCEKD